jgi:hypothetical protein
MDQAPALTLSGAVLDSPDAGELAGFYRRLLRWPVEQDEPGWVKHAVAAGAVLAGYQPQAGIRVYLEPAGHPFCLFPPA